MIHRFVLHNDAIREATESTLSAGQVGLLSGWGVFSTLRVAEGVPFAFERHWARMTRDAAAVHVQLPHEPERIRRKLLELVEANQAYNSTLRMVVVRNGGGMWAGPAVARASDFIALTAETREWEGGAKLACVPHARYSAGEFTGAKILSWAMNLTWLESVQQRGFHEALLLNERGEVAECSSANIFAAWGNQVWTPPLSSGCLPGVTREILVNEIRIPGIKIGERALTPAELLTADEVFITSTTRNLLPVAEVDGQALGCSRRVEAELLKAFTEYLSRYIAERKPAVA